MSSAIRLLVWYDGSAPVTSGKLVVNNKKATSSGTTSTSQTGTFTISDTAAFRDPDSGLAGRAFTRTWAPVTGGACGAFAPTTTVVLDAGSPPAQTALPGGCYRYEQTGTNGVGGSTSLVTTVIVD